ncbi:hypothetical protein G6F51_012371 [Rhizopus arrhizus]|uniref:Reverse transcriptase domain-containing protein n=1 Tax=Rhizopus oryzae TaxID=64495 RepID=A0A9P7C3P5_RHIOR|nr:hypothetical protein G6F51_012371 [Rhizopus arrhizus]
MPQRFIGEHGRLLQLIMSSASIQKSSAVGLLLDQEKAYDRVHPEYLSQVMRRFGIPAQLVSTIIQLFFSTRISININGHLTSPFTAQRGLRQGDPLSPLLFNIAFDPFLPDPPSVDPAGHSPPPVKILAYADDVLVFLKSPSDFNRLQQAVSIYASASNAMLNYSKTQAFSLSSDPNPTWQQFLITQNIHSWHDCRSTDSLIYLGYPVYSSTSQRNLFVDQLTNKIALSCQIHSQRNLSIRGRVTVLNCLIFSKLWHVLRIVPLTQAQIAKIQGLGAKFLNSNSFPRISFATLCLPRSKGGLGALDPAVQIQALQWRWLLPMLLSSSPDPSSTALFPRSLYPSVPYGQYLLQVNSTHGHLPPRLRSISSLLFAAYRSSYFSSFSLHCFTSLFSALDSLLCRAFDRVVLTPDTVLTLPLSSLIQIAPIAPSHPPLVSYTPSLPQVCHKPIFRRMTGSHLMILDSTTSCLRYRTFTRSEIQQFSRTTKQLINLLTSNNIQLRQSVSIHFITPAINNDFIDFTPIILSIFDADSIPQISTRLLSTSPKIFKYLSSNKQHSHHSCPCPASKTPFSYNTVLRHIASSQWSSFWQLSIPLRARTVWFKIIHRCIPHTSILHRFMPQKFPSALCPLCLTQPDSLLHFFYTCSKIQPVWIQIASLFIEQGWQHVIQFFLSDISSAVAHLSDFPLRDPSIALVPTLSTSQIVACTLQVIWSSRWVFIFQDVPFVPATVALKASTSIYQLANELDLDSDIL